MSEERARILIVEARFYPDIADEMLRGAQDALTAHGADFDVVSLPGAFEIPGAIAMADEAGHRPAGAAFDGYVALGCVIRGETSHYDHVCMEVSRGLMDLSIGRKLAIGFGVLTVEEEAQAWARAKVSQGDKGGFAANACLDMVSLRRRLLGQVR